MNRTAVFPGSFDPFTLGHLDVLKSSLKLFDHIIIGVGYNTSKNGLFPVEERIWIIRQSIAGIEHVSVESYQGLTIDFCKSSGAGFIVRGLRTTTDFEMERVIAQANTRMFPDIHTVFIPAGYEYSYITSTVVRDVFINGGSIIDFIAAGVDVELLRQKYR